MIVSIQLETADNSPSLLQRVLDELIEAYPQRLELFRTQGIVFTFRDDHSAAVKDFRHALKEARALRKARSFHRNGSYTAQSKGTATRGKRIARKSRMGKCLPMGLVMPMGAVIPQGRNPSKGPLIFSSRPSRAHRTSVTLSPRCSLSSECHLLSQREGLET